MGGYILQEDMSSVWHILQEDVSYWRTCLIGGEVLLEDMSYNRACLT